MGERAVAPVAGKVLEIALVLLYVGSVTAALYGGVVPGYRTAAGTEVGERALATSADRVEAAAVPGRNVSVRARVDLPARIRNEPYVVRAGDGVLVLDHPHPDIGGRVPLVLPDDVAVQGAWHSARPANINVTKNATGTLVELHS